MFGKQHAVIPSSLLLRDITVDLLGVTLFITFPIRSGCLDWFAGWLMAVCPGHGSAMRFLHPAAAFSPSRLLHHQLLQPVLGFHGWNTLNSTGLRETWARCGEKNHNLAEKKGIFSLAEKRYWWVCISGFAVMTWFPSSNFCKAGRGELLLLVQLDATSLF